MSWIDRGMYTSPQCCYHPLWIFLLLPYRRTREIDSSPPDEVISGFECANVVARWNLPVRSSYGRESLQNSNSNLSYSAFRSEALLETFRSDELLEAFGSEALLEAYSPTPPKVLKVPTLSWVWEEGMQSKERICLDHPEDSSSRGLDEGFCQSCFYKEFCHGHGITARRVRPGVDVVHL